MRTKINIDWLQLYGHNAVFSSPVFLYKQKQYGTKHFEYITEVYYAGEKVAEVAHGPRASILHRDSVLIKIENSQLYKENLNYVINLLLSSLQFKFIHITRVDLCVDFPRFNNNLEPNKFINKFLQNKILKIGRGTFKVVGTQKHVNEYEYLRFGTSCSDVSAYLYNKSKELNQVKNKPYIRALWSWYKNPLESWQKFDTWRLEFSIKDNKLKFYDPDTGEFVPLSLESVLIMQPREFIFNACLQHYFYFVYNNGKKKKARMRKVSMFDMEQPGEVFIKNNGKESNRMQKIFIKMFEDFNNENRTKARELAELGNKVLETYVQKYDLKAWKILKVKPNNQI